MATQIFRGLLWVSLATAIGCGNKNFPASDPGEIKIAGRDVQVIPYIESGWFGTSQSYILCETKKPSECYSRSAYKEKLAHEVDRALGE